MRDSLAETVIDADYAPNLAKMALTCAVLLVVAVGCIDMARAVPDDPRSGFMLYVGAPVLAAIAILGFFASVRANVLGHRLRLGPEGLEVPNRLWPGVRVIPWTDMTRLTRRRIRFNDMLHIVHPGGSTTLHRSGFRSSADYDTIICDIEHRASAARGHAI